MVFAQTVANRVLDSSGKAMAYNLSYDEQTMTKYGDLYDMGVKIDANYANHMITEHENLFWQGIAERSDQPSYVPLYSIDNEFSLFPRTKETCWDLSKFTASESLIHQVRFPFAGFPLHLPNIFLNFIPFHISRT